MQNIHLLYTQIFKPKKNQQHKNLQKTKSENRKFKSKTIANQKSTYMSVAASTIKKHIFMQMHRLPNKVCNGQFKIKNRSRN